METIRRVSNRNTRLGKHVVERGTVSVPVLDTWSGRKVSATDRSDCETWNLPIVRYSQRGEESCVKLATPDGSVQLALRAGERAQRKSVALALYIGDSNEGILASVNPDTSEVARKTVVVFMQEVVMTTPTRLTDDLMLFMDVLQEYMPELLDYTMEPVR